MLRSQQASKQNFIDVSTKADFAIDFHDRNARIEPRAERRIAVDVNDLWAQPVFDQRSLRVLAKVAPFARVEHNLSRLKARRT